MLLASFVVPTICEDGVEICEHVTRNDARNGQVRLRGDDVRLALPRELRSLFRREAPFFYHVKHFLRLRANWICYETYHTPFSFADQSYPVFET